MTPYGSTPAAPGSGALSAAPAVQSGAVPTDMGTPTATQAPAVPTPPRAAPIPKAPPAMRVPSTTKGAASTPLRMQNQAAHKATLAGGFLPREVVNGVARGVPGLGKPLEQLVTRFSPVSRKLDKFVTTAQTRDPTLTSNVGQAVVAAKTANALLANPAMAPFQPLFHGLRHPISAGTDILNGLQGSLDQQLNAQMMARPAPLYDITKGLPS